MLSRMLLIPAAREIPLLNQSFLQLCSTLSNNELQRTRGDKASQKRRLEVKSTTPLG